MYPVNTHAFLIGVVDCTGHGVPEPLRDDITVLGFGIKYLVKSIK